MEQYTYIEYDNVHRMLCPFDRTNTYPGEKMCAGQLCMGWVDEVDYTGQTTGRGRCGLVQKEIVIMTGVNTLYDTPSRHWWEAPKVEG